MVQLPRMCTSHNIIYFQLIVVDKSTPNPNGGKKPTLPPLRKAAEDRGINIYKKGKLKKKPELIAEMMPILDVEVDERKVKADDKQKQRAATEKKKEEEEVSIQLFMYVYMSRNINTSHITYSS